MTQIRILQGLGALTGDALVRAHDVVSALGAQQRNLARRAESARREGFVGADVVAEADAFASEVDALAAQISEIANDELAPWLAWSTDLRSRMQLLEQRFAMELSAADASRRWQIGVGVAAGVAIVGGLAYALDRMSRKRRGVAGLRRRRRR